MVRILSGLDRNKYEIVSASLQKRDERILPELENLNIEIVKFSAGSKYDIRILYKLYNFMKETKPDIVICSLFHSTILGRIIGTLTKVPVIINWEHNENLGNGFRRFLNKHTVFLSDKIFCDSQKVQQELVGQLCPDKRRVEMIPIGGINLDKYRYSEKKESTAIKIGTTGMLLKQKGYDCLLEAASIIIKKRPNVKFSIAGDGAEFQNLQDMIHHLNLSENVKLIGFQDNIPQFLATLDLYIQPSRWEGLCITVIEAMACGLPVVASNVGGIPESVIDGQNGFLIEANTPSLLAEKTVQLIDNPGLRFSMGRKGRKLAEEKYSLQKMCRCIEQNLDNLINTKTGLLWSLESRTWRQSPLNPQPLKRFNISAE